MVRCSDFQLNRQVSNSDRDLGSKTPEYTIKQSSVCTCGRPVYVKWKSVIVGVTLQSETATAS